MGDNADKLTNGADYNNAIIRPEFANVNNWAQVAQFNETGFGYDYYFTITSLKRIEVEVPEPSSLLILISGLLLILLRKLNHKSSERFSHKPGERG